MCIDIYFTSKMRTFVAVFLFAFLCAVSANEEIEAKRAECIEQTKIPKDVLDKVFDENALIEEGNPVKTEYVTCLATKLGSCSDEKKLTGSRVAEIFGQMVFPMLKIDSLYNSVKGTECGDKCIVSEGKECGERMIKLHNCMVHCYQS